MRVLLALTYYRPHVSGLTIYVQRLATELAERGHEVTVLTSQHAPDLPREETIGSVRIVRVPVWARVSKGVIMPMPLFALSHARRNDVVSIHLPQFDGGMVALASRILRRRTVLTYHCDLRLPRGVVNRIADRVTFAMNFLAGVCAHEIVAYTQDYADHSPLLRRFRKKIRVIPPPVVMAEPDASAVAVLRAEWGASDGPVVGIAARLATEKGVEYLVEAMDEILQSCPDARVVFAGAHEDVVGEAAYCEQLALPIAALGDRWRFVGVLDPEAMSAFFGAIDVLVVSSVNSTESFGLVQVEAMLCGTPVVATDLPGVRQPVRMTGMGVVVEVANASAIARGVVDVVSRHDQLIRPRAEIAQLFDIAATVDAYERLFGTDTSGRPPAPSGVPH
ncbi:MAG: glycosyltransferase family 4 protein [Ilumatobacteraceae bacterium]